jgi:hypothetical protein
MLGIKVGSQMVGALYFRCQVRSFILSLYTLYLYNMCSQATFRHLAKIYNCHDRYVVYSMKKKQIRHLLFLGFIGNGGYSHSHGGRGTWLWE